MYHVYGGTGCTEYSTSTPTEDGHRPERGGLGTLGEVSRSYSIRTGGISVQSLHRPSIDTVQHSTVPIQLESPFGSGASENSAFRFMSVYLVTVHSPG
jgi:hypothetical protein